MEFIQILLESQYLVCPLLLSETLMMEADKSPTGLHQEGLLLQKQKTKKTCQIKYTELKGAAKSSFTV